MNNTRNPWIGWASYREELISQGYNFVGRSSETSKLFSLVDNNLLVTLYGKSGIGKTSILNAGVCPSLRSIGYAPIECRCVSENNYPLSIIEQIKSKCTISVKDPKVYSNLVSFFSNNTFSQKGEEVFPVLVFDQFEDWFRVDKDAVIKLLKDIAYLNSDEYDGFTNYRFIISIREDYLYLLEDVIDICHLPELKQNRYRLSHLAKNQVEEIFNLGVIDYSVRERLLEITKDKTGYVSGLVSFFCHELHELYPNGINEDALSCLKDETYLIEKYYNNNFVKSKFSHTTKEYVENYLQEEGVRKTQNLKNVQNHISVAELNLLFNGKNKLLQKFPVGDEEYVELLHDKIAEIIYLRRNRLFKDKMIIVSICLYMILAIIAVWFILLHLFELIATYKTYNLYDITAEQFGNVISILMISYVIPKSLINYLNGNVNFKVVLYNSIITTISCCLGFGLMHIHAPNSLTVFILGVFSFLGLLMNIKVYDKNIQ